MKKTKHIFSSEDYSSLGEKDNNDNNKTNHQPKLTNKTNQTAKENHYNKRLQVE